MFFFFFVSAKWSGLKSLSLALKSTCMPILQQENVYGTLLLEYLCKYLPFCFKQNISTQVTCHWELTFFLKQEKNWQQSMVGIIRSKYIKILLLQCHIPKNSMAQASKLWHYTSCKATGKIGLIAAVSTHAPFILTLAIYFIFTDLEAEYRACRWWLYW